MSLYIKNIAKSFQEKEVLSDITFHVEKGEFVSIIGPSGSGKSTLFSIIGSILRADQGDVLLEGRSILKERGHISYMPQQDALFPWRTIIENVMMGQELVGKGDRKLAKDMLEKAGLGEVVHAYPHQLSGGMRQRASFIRALLSPQNMLLLDEPFSALDEFTRLDMQEWLLHIWEANKQSILFITHNIEEALFLSDKIVLLSKSPTVVKHVIDVSFERPRNASILLTEEFLEKKKELLHQIQD